MAAFLTPASVRVPSQGDFHEYTPLVEVFEEQASHVTLQNNINAFLAGLPAAAGTQIPIVLSVQFDTTVKGAAVMYSALVWYAFVGPGGAP